MAAGNSYPASFTDEAGTERLVGELNFTDSGDQPGDSSLAAVSSDDGSIDVVAPSGPTVDLSVLNSPSIAGVTVDGTTAGAGKALIASSSSAAAFALPTALPRGWTQSADDPADVNSNGGNLSVHAVASDAGVSAVDFVANPDNPGDAVFEAAGGAIQAVSDLDLTGLTGAVSAVRYVGGTATVAPTTGDFLLGDFVVSLNGSVWVCTVSGTPGTWVQAGSVLLAPKAAPTFTGHVTIPQATAVLDAAALNQLTSALTITSGTLPNLGSWVSGTGIVNPVTRQISAVVAMVSSGTAATATNAIAVSPDNTTYTTVGTQTVSTAVNTVGALQLVTSVTVPAGWYLKCTFANATVAASIYY